MTVRPSLGAGRVRTNGNVSIQSDRHAERARFALRSRELIGREPLEIEKVFDLFVALARKAHDRWRARVSIVIRPTRPSPILRSLQPKMRIERIVDRMEPQRVALRFYKGAKLRRSRRVVTQVCCTELLVEELHDLELRGGDFLVVDIRRRSSLEEQALKLFLRDAFAGAFAARELRDIRHADVEHVQEQPVRGTVGADLLRIRGCKRMERIQSDQLATRRRSE